MTVTSMHSRSNSYKRFNTASREVLRPTTRLKCDTEKSHSLREWAPCVHRGYSVLRGGGGDGRRRDGI